MRESHRKRRAADRAGTSDVNATPLGPAWLPLREAWEVLAAETGPYEAAAVLGDAIESGRLIVFTDSLFKEPPDSEGWGADLVNRRDAEREGLAESALAGPTQRSFALSAKFWRQAGCLRAAFCDWGSANIHLLVAEGSADGRETPGRGANWEIRSPVISALQLELLRKLIEVGAYKPPAPDSAKVGGRRRSSKWDHWTAYLVEYAFEMGFGHPWDVEASAEDIAARLDDKLAFDGHGKVDARDARRTVEAVLRHVAKRFPGQTDS